MYASTLGPRGPILLLSLCLVATACQGGPLDAPPAATLQLSLGTPLGTPCGPITAIGCCNGTQLIYCYNKQAYGEQCSSKPSCGWSTAAKKYACGTSGGADPTGTNAKTCPAPPSDGGSGPPVCGDGKCDAKAEDCAMCPKDCGACDGCKPLLGGGCPGCACEACVCKAVSSCCGTGGLWSQACVTACKTQCGGCGTVDAGGPLPGDAGSSFVCGDKKCEKNKGEDCNGCPQDCGPCDGCSVMTKSGCPGCKCQSCVCSKNASCCGPGGAWTQTCVDLCKNSCGGCGSLEAGVGPPGDGSPRDGPPIPDGFPYDAPPIPDGLKYPDGIDLGQDSWGTDVFPTTGQPAEEGCSCRATPGSGAAPAWLLLALGVLGWRRRRPRC